MCPQVNFEHIETHEHLLAGVEIVIVKNPVRRPEDPLSLRTHVGLSRPALDDVPQVVLANVCIRKDIVLHEVDAEAEQGGNEEHRSGYSIQAPAACF